MRKNALLIIFILIMVVLSGCYASTFNRLSDEETLVYENEDKTVRLEIGMKTSSTGRLYVLHDDISQSFVVNYTIIQEYMDIYIDVPELEEDIFKLEVSFKVVNFFKTNYEVMYLKEIEKSGITNPKHEIFTDFDVTLHRNYDETVRTLNYFNNKWQADDAAIVTYYYSNKIQGTLNGESVWISFLNESFTIWSKGDLNMKLSGGVTFEGLNIVLEPFEWYTEYLSKITLAFMAITNA